MKLISWNIDSLNAALTSDSARAKLSQEVLQTLVAENADIIAIQETKLSAKGPTKTSEILEELFPGYANTWRSSQEPARKGYAGTMFLYKKELTPTVTFPEIGAPSTMDLEGRIITLEFDEFFVTQVYTPNAGDGLKRLEERQVWDVKYAEYLAELDKENQSLQPVTTTWPTMRSTLQILLATAVHQDLLTRNVLDLPTFWQLDLPTPSAIFMAMFQNATLGGHNAARLLKSTIQAGESTTGSQVTASLIRSLNLI